MPRPIGLLRRHMKLHFSRSHPWVYANWHWDRGVWWLFVYIAPLQIFLLTY